MYDIFANPERVIMVQTEEFIRKPFTVEAVHITEENMEEVATWCQGVVERTDEGAAYIKVKVHNPLTERQTRGFVGDWILFAGKGYKVYTDKAFEKSFDRKTGVTVNVFDGSGNQTLHAVGNGVVGSGGGGGGMAANIGPESSGSSRTASS